MKTLHHKEDSDFADHVLATRQEVKEFYPNDGPEPSKLKNDEYITWPKYLSKFIDKIVWDRFTCLMSIWKQSQINSDGELKIPRQQENQIVCM